MPPHPASAGCAALNWSQRARFLSPVGVRLVYHRCDAAKTTLAEAREITASAGVGPESELGLALARARGVIGASDIAAIPVPSTSSRRTAHSRKSAN